MKKVVVGMSGGVDSSVAALLLKKQGYDVVGVTMQIWQEEAHEAAEQGGCCGFSAVEDARRVAEVLDIPHYVMNFRREFRENVMDYFVAEYLAGRTPNPCIACNRYVKWEYSCCPGACPSGRTILLPGITPEWNGCQTAGIPSAARQRRQRIRPMHYTI